MKHDAPRDYVAQRGWLAEGRRIELRPVTASGFQDHALPSRLPSRAEDVGIEPTRLLHRTGLANRLLTIRISSGVTNYTIATERRLGLEPRLTGWKPAVLPIELSPRVRGR